MSGVESSSTCFDGTGFFLIHTEIYSITGDLQALVMGRNIKLPIHFKKLQFPKLSFSDSIGSLSFCTAAFISFMSIWAKKSSSCHPACKYQCEEEEEGTCITRIPVKKPHWPRLSMDLLCFSLFSVILWQWWTLHLARVSYNEVTV